MKPTDDGVTEEEIQAIYAKKMQEAKDEIQEAKERKTKEARTTSIKRAALEANLAKVKEQDDL